MEDKTIVCVDCSQPFVFTAGEQQFYADRGLTELPKRCKPCRNARRRRLGRRRRAGADASRPTAGEAPELEQAPPPDGGAAAPASGGTGAAERPRARTFWDDRPQWVREAMERAAAPAPSPGNGTHQQGNGRGDAAQAAEPRKKRRRTRRRPRRGGAVAEGPAAEAVAASDAAQDDPGADGAVKG